MIKTDKKTQKTNSLIVYWYMTKLPAESIHLIKKKSWPKQEIISLYQRHIVNYWVQIKHSWGVFSLSV